MKRGLRFVGMSRLSRWAVIYSLFSTCLFSQVAAKVEEISAKNAIIAEKQKDIDYQTFELRKMEKEVA